MLADTNWILLNVLYSFPHNLRTQLIDVRVFLKKNLYKIYLRRRRRGLLLCYRASCIVDHCIIGNNVFAIHVCASYNVVSIGIIIFPICLNY